MWNIWFYVVCRMFGACARGQPYDIVYLFQGDADSALDRLWQKKKAEIRQQ